MKKKRYWITVLKKTIFRWSDDNIAFISASLAYYTMFSLAPLIIICLSLAGLFFGQEAVQNQLLNQIYHTIGSGSAYQIKTMIAKAMTPQTSIINQIIGVIILIFAASGAFDALQTGLNSVWNVKQKSDRGIKKIIKSRLLSFKILTYLFN